MLLMRIKRRTNNSPTDTEVSNEEYDDGREMEEEEVAESATITAPL